MTCLQWLELAANTIAILTGIGAAYAYGSYRYDRWRKMKRLEDYLKSQKVKADDKGQRTPLHLMAALALTEADVLQAAFDSKKVKPRLKPAANSGLASTLLLEYCPEQAN